MKLLHIDSSPLKEGSVSRQLTAKVVATFQSAQIEYLDLIQTPPAHLTQDAMGFRTATEANSPAQVRENEVSEKLVQQFLNADVIVIGAPMYNFSVPSQLKAWIDRVAQPGRTFKYSPEGPKGLAGGKKVIIVSTRGGFYFGKPHEVAMDHQEAYLKGFFAFVGITDVKIIRAEGLNVDPQIRVEAIAEAERAIQLL